MRNMDYAYAFSSEKTKNNYLTLCVGYEKSKCDIKKQNSQLRNEKQNSIILI